MLTVTQQFSNIGSLKSHSITGYTSYYARQNANPKSYKLFIFNGTFDSVTVVVITYDYLAGVANWLC